jgi:hypothetical protein
MDQWVTRIAFDGRMIMNCRKIKLITFQDNFEYINFSKKNDLKNVKKGYDYANDDFSMPDTVWIVHELDGLNLIEKTAPGSVVVAVIRSELKDGDILELPFDLKKYFIDEKLMVVLGGEVEEQAALCSSLIDIDKFSGWKPFFGIGTLEKDISYFKTFYRSLGAKLNVKNLYKNTSIHTTHIFLRNALINAPLMHNKIKISDYYNALSNKPFLVVAAGPSLNKQLPNLAKYQEYFNILAVDTIWPILDKFGIKPDLVFALDSRSKPSWPRNCVADETCFSIDIGCAPKLVWSHDQNHLFSSTSEQIRSLLDYLGVEVDVLATGGSVATSAFNFARYLGGNPIVLIGQDLALTGGKDHADGYLHVYSDALLKARSESGFDVDGYYGDRVKTESQLLYYKTWYEEQVKAHPDVMVINSTEGGAKIEGCLQIPFQAVCDELQKTNKSKTFFFPKYKMVFNSQHLLALTVKLDDLIEGVNGFIQLAQKGEFLTEKIEARSISRLLKKIDKINDDLMGYDKNVRFSVDAFSQLKMEQIRIQVVTDKSEKNIDKAIDKYREVYVGIQESGHQCLVMLDQIRTLYRRLSDLQSYDPALLEEIFPT